MKKFISFILIITAFGASAQQLPQYTQYTFNQLLINPAVTGVESYWDFKAGYRSQWTGLQGAPTTAYLTMSIPLNKNFSLYDYSQILSNADNPMGNSNGYSAPASHSGIGLNLVSDKAGAFKQTHLDIDYAYHIRMSESFNLALGASFGINNISLNTAELNFSNPLDPAITQGAGSQLKPEAGLGLYAYGQSFFIGASAQQLIPQTISFSSNTSYSSQSKTYAQYFLSAGLKLYPSDDVTLLPSLVFKPNDIGPLNFDANIKVAFRDNFWIGGAYRKNDAVSGSFGFNLGAFLTVGYAYDYTTSNLNNVSNGSHELMIGILLNNNYNVTSARHTW
ncbi:type IX secretion system membrane protein PorP/SprF [Mucilaginibacter sp. HMF5004]|uniref:PorP/SprF family type IX secretion system membrane protein n=1 Tax=Mucilaginibacter rivuli TaxID=2857527 RepID=UPI001C5E727D|nr:type IX secretion system membrane protein PorP/SprF [Mucilaginibacter rivuli]MBW4890164.1 type IX secretion system membrane protein PorP/SprF [Mucilaginibacter rivuli]